jgi:hypothetical protein
MTEPVPYTGLEYALRIDGTTPSTDWDGADSISGIDPDFYYVWGAKTLVPFSNTVIDPAQVVFVRYRDDVVDDDQLPEVDWTYTTTYSAITIRSVSLSCTSHTPDGVFVTNTGDEYTYITLDTGGSNWINIAQTTDREADVENEITAFTTEFDFYKVFDQTQISYLPFESDYDAVAVVNQAVPSTPYDPDTDPPTLPIDSLNYLIPDGRITITVIWALSFTYTIDSDGGQTVHSGSIEIQQELSQPVQDWGSVIQGYQERSSFVVGFRPLKGVPDPNDHVLEWDWYDDDLAISDTEVEHVTIVPE